MTREDTLYKITSQIPKGKVTTYGNLARLSGIKNPRVVGNILHKNTDSEKIPCHRVVNSKGKVAQSFAFGGSEGQIQKLKSESVQVVNGKVFLPKYFWKG